MLHKLGLGLLINYNRYAGSRSVTLPDLLQHVHHLQPAQAAHQLRSFDVPAMHHFAKGVSRMWQQYWT